MLYNNNNPLLHNDQIFGYYIWSSQNNDACITDTDDTRVYLGWVNHNMLNTWSSLSFLKFNYFQEIDESGKCFVGIQVDQFGHKLYRIFKTRISNLKINNLNHNPNIVTYPAISCESYSDLQWLPQERVFKVLNLSGECSILIPPRWKQCNDVPFHDKQYDPYSQFKYWPNTDFGHFKDLRFHGKVLFGENYDGTLAIISSEGEIMSYAWSDVQITDSGIIFLDKKKNLQRITFNEIEDYYNNELQEESPKIAQQSTQDKCIENLPDKIKPDTNNTDNYDSVADEKYENICWMYKNWQKQYDNTIQINSPNKMINEEEPILCLYKKNDINTAYIVRYMGSDSIYHPIERIFKLTDETIKLRKTLKSGKLPKAMQYRPEMTDEELVESFKAIAPTLCAAQSESEIQDNNCNNIQTKEEPMKAVQESCIRPISELNGNDFANKIKEVYDFLSISFPFNKVFECMLFLFGENIKNIKGYTSETDTLIKSIELDLAEEIEKEVNDNKKIYLSDEQLENFNTSIHYHTKVKAKSYMESLEIALTDASGSEKFASYIENIKANFEKVQYEKEKELPAKIIEYILKVKDESNNQIISTIHINDNEFNIGDTVHKENLLGNLDLKKFICIGDCLLIFSSEAECIDKGIYMIRNKDENSQQVIGKDEISCIFDTKKRKFIISKTPYNGVYKIFDEVVYIDTYIDESNEMNFKFMSVG